VHIMTRVFSLLSCFLLVTGRPNKLSHITDTSVDEDVSASQTVNSYLAPEFDEEPAASQAVESYLIPIHEEHDEEPAASETVDSYLVPILEEPDEEVAASQVINSYLGPAPEIEAAASSRTLDSYFGPSLDKEAAPSETKKYYAVPTADVLVPQPSVARRVVVSAPTAAPIAILRSAFTGPQDGNYAYSFETENGISQDVEGRMKIVDDTQVYVMTGAYSYIGNDGNTWKVEWYADETGFHPSAPFLPKSVQPIHPEVARAVEAQLRFAADEEAAAAASSTNEVFALPEAGLAGYGDQEDAGLAGYGEQDVAATYGNSVTLGQTYGRL